MSDGIHSFNDLKVLITTDRRVWLAAGFICTCAFIFLVTGSWREVYVEEVPEEWKRIRIPTVEFNEKINALNQGVEDSRREREELSLRISRATNEIQSQTQEIDWQADRLINSLESMSSKLDNIVDRVGSQRIKSKEIERLSGASKNKQKR